MARTKDKPKIEKNRYTLREGYSIRQGDELLTGPEYVYLSLDQANAHKHQLEERAAIDVAWADRQKKAKEALRQRNRELMEERHAEGVGGRE